MQSTADEAGMHALCTYSDDARNARVIRQLVHEEGVPQLYQAAASLLAGRILWAPAQKGRSMLFVV